MIINEHNETYCKAEITDNAGRTQTIKKGIIVDIEDIEAIEIHLLNLNIDQKLMLVNQFMKELNNKDLVLCRQVS